MAENNIHKPLRIAIGPKSSINSAALVAGRLEVASDTDELYFTTLDGGSRKKIGDIIEVDSLDDVLAPVSNKFYYKENTLYRRLDGEWQPVGSDVFVTMEEYEEDAEVMAAAFNNLDARVIAVENKNLTVASTSEDYITITGDEISINGLDTQFTVLAESIIDLQSRVLTNTGDISNHYAELSQVKTAVNTLNGSDTTAGSVAKQIKDAKESIVGTLGEGDSATLAAINDELDGIDTSITSLNNKTQINGSDNILSWGDNGISSTLSLVYENETIKLIGKDNAVISSFSASDFIKDGMLNSATLVEEKPVAGADPIAGHFIKLTWNTDAGISDTYIDITNFLNVYTGKTGEIVVTNGEISLDSDVLAKINEAHTHDNKDILDGITEPVLTVARFEDESFVMARAFNDLNTRVLANASTINGLNYTDTYTAGQFVSKVNEANGKIAPSHESFITDIANNADSQIAPTTQAIKEYVDNSTPDIEYTTDIAANITSANAPTTAAVVTYVGDKVKISETSEPYLTFESDGFKFSGLRTQLDVIAGALNDLDARIIANEEDADEQSTVLANSLNEMNDRVLANTNNITNNYNTLNQRINDLDYTDSYTAGQFVSKVDEADGVISSTHESFVTEITDSTTSLVAPTATAVKNYVTTKLSDVDVNIELVEGNGITVTEGEGESSSYTISAKIDETNDEGYLSVDADGLKVTGLQTQFEVISQSLNELNLRVASNTGVLNNLNYSDTYTEGTFVSKVDETNGKIASTHDSFITDIEGNPASQIAPTTQAIKEYVDNSTPTIAYTADIASATTEQDAQAPTTSAVKTYVSDNVKVDSDSEVYLSYSSNGFKIAGIREQFDVIAGALNNLDARINAINAQLGNIEAVLDNLLGEQSES